MARRGLAATVAHATLRPSSRYVDVAMPSLTVAPFSIADSARVHGQFVWIEQRLFALLGTSVSATPERPVKYHLGVYCYRHSWHAELFTKLLPTPIGVHPYGVIAPPQPEMVQLIESVASFEDTIDRLVGLYRVLLPACVDNYRKYLSGCSPVTDGPTIRVIDLVLRDDECEQQAGEILLDDLLQSRADHDRAEAIHLNLTTGAHPTVSRDAGGEKIGQREGLTDPLS